MDSSSGKIANTLVLKMSGSELTGTLTNQFGVLPLQNGHVDGQDLFFVVIVKEEGDPFRMVYRGHIFSRRNTIQNRSRRTSNRSRSKKE